AQAAADAAAAQQAQARIQELAVDVAHITQVRDNIQTNYDKLKVAHKESQAAGETLAAELAETRQELAAAELRGEELLAQGDAAREAFASDKEALDARVAELTDEGSRLAEELASEQAARAGLEADKQRLESEAADLARRIEAARAEHAAEAAGLRRELDVECAAHDSTRDSLAQTRAAVAELEARNAQLAEELQIEAEAAKQAFEELAQEHHELERAHGRLSDQHRRAIASTQAWLTELQDASIRHRDELAGLDEDAT
ncbi:hypothetical protein IWQ56_005354, partial [Coemansia nantahalensis]